MDINPCPGCKKKCRVLCVEDAEKCQVYCIYECGYKGPHGKNAQDAIERHNLISRPSQEPAPVQPEPEAYMFSVRRVSPAGQPYMDTFAAIEYYLEEGEELKNKVPLYASPSAPAVAQDRMTETLKPAWMALSFFESVIKSGERWSESCVDMRKKAGDALRALEQEPK